jgi:hypothetical protein
MRRLTLAATILAVGTIGCDRLPFIGGRPWLSLPRRP